MKPNPIVWFEIYVQDMERARKFYETVFQCTLEALTAPDDAGSADGSLMLAFPMSMEGTGAGGMLVQMKDVASGGGGTLVYFGCEDCAVEQGRVESAGGKVHRGKFAIGQYGQCALVSDTEGNMIGLHSMQ
ncbi:VOC family protein [Ottowia thiooxydans]|uniref:VOC family protein n=1 Tax=Ottowia thiooxydans TaxID=219182 RepID=UPI00041D4323|nr:VOC family protein [Ottowia thiooxydans]